LRERGPGQQPQDQDAVTPYGLSVGLVTGDFDSGAFSVYFMGVGGFQAVLTGLYLAFHRKDHGDW